MKQPRMTAEEALTHYFARHGTRPPPGASMKIVHTRSGSVSRRFKVKGQTSAIGNKPGTIRVALYDYNQEVAVFRAYGVQADELDTEIDRLVRIMQGVSQDIPSWKLDELVGRKQR